MGNAEIANRAENILQDDLFRLSALLPVAGIRRLLERATVTELYSLNV
jgi:hypothetical protein